MNIWNIQYVFDQFDHVIEHSICPNTKFYTKPYIMMVLIDIVDCNFANDFYHSWDRSKSALKSSDIIMKEDSEQKYENEIDTYSSI